VFFVRKYDEPRTIITEPNPLPLLQSTQGEQTSERPNGMTVNVSRSQNAELLEGATDGKYRKRRPNTTVAAGMGDQEVIKNRSGLHPYMNYGFINSEDPNKVNPGE
jgi:hypothetical protein